MDLNLSGTGVLGGTPTAAGTFNLTVTATDSSTPRQSVSKTLTLTIAPALTIVTATLPDGVVSQTYPGVTLQALGGVSPYGWSAPSLPAGLNLSGAVLGGTATSAGTFDVTITATDSSSPPHSVSRTLTLTIAAALTIAIGSLPDGVINQTYSAFPLQAQGGRAPYTWSASGLPGLGLTAGGVLSGIPRSIGTFNITVAVTDSSSPPLTTSRTLPRGASSAATVRCAASSMWIRGFGGSLLTYHVPGPYQ